MIQKVNFTAEYINKLCAEKKTDITILERNIYALGLLEALAKVGLKFIFKGGTSLTILLNKPSRLSTDIDIVVEPNTNIRKYIDSASKIFPFKTVEKEERNGKSKIVKEHYLFTYESPAFNRDFYIMLDVVYEKNNYSKILKKQIKNDFIITREPYDSVLIPSIDCIMADKLTAFAPHTIGIQLNKGKDIEIIKQMYDISCLFDEMSEFNDLYNSYIKIANTEILYRNESISVDDVLKDTIESSVCIASRGQYGEDYNLYLDAIKGLSQHIFDFNFTGEMAVLRACKVMYIASCVLKNKESKKITDINKYHNTDISKSKYAKLGKIRNLEPLGFAYIVEAINILKI